MNTEPINTQSNNLPNAVEDDYTPPAYTKKDIILTLTSGITGVVLLILLLTGAYNQVL